MRCTNNVTALCIIARVVKNKSKHGAFRTNHSLLLSVELTPHLFWLACPLYSGSAVDDSVASSWRRSSPCVSVESLLKESWWPRSLYSCGAICYPIRSELLEEQQDPSSFRPGQTSLVQVLPFDLPFAYERHIIGWAELTAVFGQHFYGPDVQANICYFSWARELPDSVDSSRLRWACYIGVQQLKNRRRKMSTSACNNLLLFGRLERSQSKAERSCRCHHNIEADIRTRGRKCEIS